MIFPVGFFYAPFKGSSPTSRSRQRSNKPKTGASVLLCHLAGALNNERRPSIVLEIGSLRLDASDERCWCSGRVRPLRESFE